MRWKIQLDGHTTGLQELSEAFQNDPQIFEDEGEYYLWSAQFEALDNSRDVRDIGNDIVTTVRNLGEIDSLRIGELDISNIVKIQNDGSEKIIVHLSARGIGVGRGSARIQIDDEELAPKATSTYKYTKLALKDNSVYELLRIRNNGDHWVNLYRIYEFIQDNIECDENIVAQGWWSKSEKNLFKRTANSPEAIGHEARHATGRSAPPDPMDHSEAKSLINGLIKNWLSHRESILKSKCNDN